MPGALTAHMSYAGVLNSGVLNSGALTDGGALTNRGFGDWARLPRSGFTTQPSVAQRTLGYRVINVIPTLRGLHILKVQRTVNRGVVAFV